MTIRLSNGQTWSPQNDDRRFSGQVMLVDALTRSMNVPTVNLGMALGLPAVVDTGLNWGRRRISSTRCRRCCLAR